MEKLDSYPRIVIKLFRNMSFRVNVIGSDHRESTLNWKVLSPFLKETTPAEEKLLRFPVTGISLQRGLLLKERICSKQESVLSFKSCSHREGRQTLSV